METLNHPIADKIIAKYPSLVESLKVQREKRIWVKVAYSDFANFLNFVHNDLRINIFCMLTGLDDKNNYSFIYHLANVDGLMLNIETSVPKSEAIIETVTDKYPAADLQEREVVDLFGVKVNGLAEGKRYPLPDNWPDGEYPMRKDWTQDRLDKNPLKEEKKEDCNA
jgi:Ni,Fe-hydrogenase III component G